MNGKRLKGQALVIFVALLIIIFILLAVIAYLIYQKNLLEAEKKSNSKNVTTYQECVDAGYPILESFPSRCMTPDGKSFTNPDESVESDANPGAGEIKTETFSVYFPKTGESDPSKVYEAKRSVVGRDWGTLEEVSLEYLITGPSIDEKSYYSAISLSGTSSCEGKDFILEVKNKAATVKFCKDLKLEGDLSGGRVVTSVTKTLKQFKSITDVTVLDKNGNCVGDLSGLNNC